MKIHNFLIVICALMVFNQAYAKEKSPKNSEFVAKEAVKETLSDPNSVQFKAINKNLNGDVCGQYNAKNKHGGYVGFEYFMYDFKRKILLNIEADQLQKSIDRNVAEARTQTYLALTLLKFAERDMSKLTILQSKIAKCSLDIKDELVDPKVETSGEK